jgi:hypothetical protein
VAVGTSAGGNARSGSFWSSAKASADIWAGSPGASPSAPSSVAESAQEAKAQEASAHEASAQEAADQDAAAHDAALHDAVDQEASAQDAAAQDALPATVEAQLAESKFMPPEPEDVRNALRARLAFGGVLRSSAARAAFI